LSTGGVSPAPGSYGVCLTGAFRHRIQGNAWDHIVRRLGRLAIARFFATAKTIRTCRKMFPACAHSPGQNCCLLHLFDFVDHYTFFAEYMDQPSLGMDFLAPE